MAKKEKAAAKPAAKKPEKKSVKNTKKKVDVPVYGMNATNMSVYLNHSKKPSLKFTKVGELISLRKIDAGEELTIDYDKSFGEKHVFK